MRPFLTLILTGFSILRSAPVVPNPTVVQGRFVGKNIGSQHLPYGLMSIKVKAGTATLATSCVQINGKFELVNQANKPVDLYYSALGVNGDVYVATIPAAQPDTLRLAIQLPVSYAKKHGRTICPKCKRADKVRDIIYGDGSAIVVRSISLKGDTIYLPYDKKHYYAGTCLVNELDPNWYCVRDTIRF
jgi:hypothetical protein